MLDRQHSPNMGNKACSPSSETINCLFEVASHAGIVPDISLDRTLTNFLSRNSTAALEHQYAAIQQNMSAEQLTAFNQDLTSAFGGSTKVSLGGLGIVALALSLLFEVLTHQIHEQRSYIDPIRRIFGADYSSEIGPIVSEYLKQVPGIANDKKRMAELLKHYDEKLKQELDNFYSKLVIESSMSSAGVKQWLNGAAFHMHMRIHWFRLTALPEGPVDVLNQYYQLSIPGLIKTYTEFLQRNIQETPSLTKSKGMSGLLVIEPYRNVTHRVQHRPCESKVIEEFLLARIIAAQDIEQSKYFFLHTESDFDDLFKQRGDFELKK